MDDPDRTRNENRLGRGRVSAVPRIRRELRHGDIGGIIAHHGRVYGREYGVDTRFEGHVAASLARAAARGWPGAREGIWLVEVDGELAGSIGLTDDGNDEATLRWFVLNAELRGQGLGRRLLGEVLAKAEDAGYERIGLETFSELEAAAHLYLDHGFELVWAETAPRWGRTEITYQRYELALPRAHDRPGSGTPATTRSP